MSARRNQYRLARKNARDNFRESSDSVPFVSDSILTGIPDFRGVYAKGITEYVGPVGQDVRGPNKGRYQLFIEGLKERNITKVNTVVAQTPRFADAYSLFDYELYGMHRDSFSIPPAPTITSNEGAAELLEVYAMALLRDFDLTLLDSSSSEYDTFTNEQKQTVQKYVDALNDVKQYIQYSPKNNANITIGTLFRGLSPGDLRGPYLSQFLFYPAYLGNFYAEQKFVLYDNSRNKIDINKNYGLDYNYVKDLLNGISKPLVAKTQKLRFLQTIRDAAIYINRDEIWQPFFITAAILLDNGIKPGFFTSARKAPSSRFVNLGPVDLYTLMMKAVKLAMNACWVWKWRQLKQRPEEMAFQVHMRKKYPSDPSGVNFPEFLFQNRILVDISNNNQGNLFMPMAYSQGSPCHPSYPSGHATIAGASATILKAWFNCDNKIQLVVPNSSGDSLEAYREVGGDSYDILVKIGDEIDKLASNCGITRNFAGIHYGSDAYGGLLLGEQVAIALLKDEVHKYQDKICFRFRKRNNDIVEIKNHNDIITPESETTYSNVANQYIYPIKDSDTDFITGYLRTGFLSTADPSIPPPS
jgi:membrane-associated phospholipid phosphatase